MKVLKYENESVFIQSGTLKFWIDVYIENEDVMCDWNKNSFYLTNQADIALKKWQDNLDNFENASELAVKTLVNAGVIYQNKYAKWFRNL